MTQIPPKLMKMKMKMPLILMKKKMNK